MKVLVTSRLPEKIREKMEKKYEVVQFENGDMMPQESLLTQIEDYEALVCPLSQCIDREVIEKGRRLKLIANFGAGFNNIDLKAASKRGIAVTNTPAQGSTRATAEITMALILMIMRDIPRWQKDLGTDRFRGWRPTYGMGESLSGKILGIIGMGSIGTAVAQCARAFGMNVLYWNRSSKEVEGALAVRSREEIYEKADVITLHLAYNEKLKHLISQEQLNKMKPDAVLINAARGPLIDEKALIEHLKKHPEFKVGLDVYEREPLFSQELLQSDQAVLFPHLGNATVQAREEMGEMILQNLDAVVKGQKPPFLVNDNFLRG